MEDIYRMLSRINITSLRNITQAHWLFIVISAVFGLVFVFFTPPLWGFDEVAHFNRAYQVAEGKFVPPVDAYKKPKTEMPQSLVELEYYVYGDLMNNKKDTTFRKDVDSRDVYSKLLSRKFSPSQQNVPIIAAYSPISYIAPSLGIFAGRSLDLSIGSTITLARFFSLVFYLALGFLALYILKDKKLKWIIFSVALLPMSIFQGAVVSADGALIGISLLFIASLLRLLLDPNTTKKKTLLSIVFTAAILMPVIKINYLFLSLGVLLLPGSLFKTKIIMYFLKLTSAVLMILPAIVWSIVTNVTRSGTSSERSDGGLVVPSDQIEYILHHPIDIIIVFGRTIATASDSYITSVTSSIGWNGTQLPFVFILLIFFGIFIAAMYAKQELAHIHKKIYFLSAFVLLGIMSIFGVLYITFNPTGYERIDGVQGRYFIPFLVPVILLVATFLPLEIKIKDKVVPLLFVGITTTVLVFSVLYYYLATY